MMFVEPGACLADSKSSKALVHCVRVEQGLVRAGVPQCSAKGCDPF